MEFKLKECFICNFCKTICGACNDDLERLKQGTIDDKNRDLIGRKQEIDCLGKYCDKPCKLQDLSAVPDTQTLINTIMFLGNKVNELLFDEHE